MRHTRSLSALLLATAALAVACDDDDDNGPQTTQFVAEMRGANEVPAVNTTATGRATAALTGNTLTYAVDVTGLSSRPVGAHIHVGATGVNGAIVLSFFPGGTATIPDIRSGTLVSSTSIDLTSTTVAGLTITGDSLRRLITSGNAYVNVHTQTNPGGEIRAQLVRQ
jgi:hypothetical protein